MLCIHCEKHTQNAGTSKKKTVLEDSDESSDDSSDEEDTPRTLNYRAPLFTQVNLISLLLHMCSVATIIGSL